MALPLPRQLVEGTRPEPAAPAAPAPKARRSKRLVGLASLIAGPVIWFTPPPDAVAAQTWHLFAIFASTVFSVVIGASPILTAAVISLAAAVLTETLAPAEAYAGFANPTIVLVVVALLITRAFVKCGLGQRLAYHLISLLGRSTLGLSYSLFVLDALIAPALPGVNARSRLLHQLATSMAEAADARSGREDRKRLGRFLTFSGMTSLTLSSALWLTAMAGNLVGAELAKRAGVSIGFVSWLVAAAIPTLVAMMVVPFLLYKSFRPEVAATPAVPAEARRALAEMGPWTRDEKTVGFVVLGMIVLWGLIGTLGVTTTAIAFLGLGLLFATNVLSVEDVRDQGDVLATYIWFAVLFTMSTQLNALGFMEYVDQRIVTHLGPLPVPLVAATVVIVYVLLHYLFVDQTVQLLTLFSVFLGAGVKFGVPAPLLAYELLFATSYVAMLAPRASSGNAPFANSGVLSLREMYGVGAVYTAFLMVLYLVVGTPWLMMVTR